MISAKARHAPSFVRGSEEEIAFCKIGTNSEKILSPFFLHNSPRVREAVSCCSISGLPSSDMIIDINTGNISLVVLGVSTCQPRYIKKVKWTYSERALSKYG